jgi:hypothetical protein
MNKKDLFSTTSRILLRDEKLIVNNMQNEIITYSKDLKEVNRSQINTEGVINIIQIENNIYGIEELANQKARFLKFNRACDSILWESRTIELCKAPWSHILKKKNNILYSCIKDYIINDNTGKVSYADLKIDKIIQNKLDNEQFLFKINMHTDSFVYKAFNKKYTITKHEISTINTGLSFQNYSAIAKFKNGFVIIQRMANDKQKILVLNSDLQVQDSVATNFTHAKSFLEEGKLCLIDLFEGVYLYDLDEMTVSKIISTENCRFYDMAILDSNLYVLSSLGLNMHSLNKN